MIAKDAGTGKSFIGLARYLEHGKAGEHEERVLWSHGENLFTNDIATASAIMRETAALNDNGRLQKPVYHYSINWHPDESHQVTKDVALLIAQESLKDLGLENHQALIVAHDDRDHFHLHVVVNRHDPDIGKAWNPDFTYVKLEKAMARLSQEHGFAVVPGHHNSKDLGIEPPSVDTSLPSQAAEYEDRTGQPSFITQVRSELADTFDQASSWSQLAETLAEKGYHFEARGNGMVITDGNQYAKPSSIDRDYSRHKLEARFNEPLKDYEDKRGPKPIIEPSKPPAAKDFADQIRPTVLPHLKSATTWHDLEQRLAGNGLVIMRQGRGLVLSDGQNQTKLSSISRDTGINTLTKRFDQTFKQHQYDARSVGNPKTRLTSAASLKTAVADLQAHRKLLGRIEARKTELADTIIRTAGSVARVKEVSEAKSRFQIVFRNTYKNPIAAAAAFEKTKKHGLKKAFEQYRKNPQRFGALKGAGFGPIKNNSRLAAERANKLGARISERYEALVISNAKDRKQIDADMKAYIAARQELSLLNGFKKPQLPKTPDDPAVKDFIKNHKTPRLDWAQGYGNLKAASERTTALEKAVIAAAKGLSVAAIQQLPMASPMLAKESSAIVQQLREENEVRFDPSISDIKQRQAKIKASRETPPRPLSPTATPRQRDHYALAGAYAAARDRLKTSSSKETLGAVQKAADDLYKAGPMARIYLKHFNVDQRTLSKDLKAGRSLQYARKRIDRAHASKGFRLGRAVAKIASAGARVKNAAGRYTKDRGRERER